MIIIWDEHKYQSHFTDEKSEVQRHQAVCSNSHSFWGTWVAQSVKHPTAAQVMISCLMSSSPASGSVLTAQILEPASGSVSFSLSPCCLHSVSLCLKWTILLFWITHFINRRLGFKPRQGTSKVHSQGHVLLNSGFLFCKTGVLLRTWRVLERMRKKNGAETHSTMPDWCPMRTFSKDHHEELPKVTSK